MGLSKVLFWRGCTLRNILPETTLKIESILKRAGFEATILDDEGCCGYPLLLAGYEEQFKATATKVVEKIGGVQYDMVVTHCPGCLRTFTQLYPKSGFKPLKVVHTTQLLRQLVGKGVIKLKNYAGLKVTYHDPCDLGRHLGIYDEPRELMRSIPGLDLVELPEISMGKYSRCCGGGGLLRLVIPPLASQIAIDRIVEDVAGLGVQAIITACPTCVKTLRDAASVVESIYGVSIAVLDIVDLIYSTLG